MEVNKNIVSNCKFYCVTGEGGRCGNGHFCGDVIFEWPHSCQPKSDVGLQVPIYHRQWDKAKKQDF